MNKIKLLPGIIALVWLASCNVHEWPQPEETEPFVLHLEFETAFPILEHNITTRDSKGLELISYYNVAEEGVMRYHVRAFPTENNEIISEKLYHTFQDITLIKGNYDRDFTIELTPGTYRIIVWSDLRETTEDEHFYDMSDFSDIKLKRHESNKDYRDCFRGYADIKVTNNITLKNPDSILIHMERPVAKFEFITNDLVEFIGKENEKNNKDYNEEIYNGNIETRYNDLADFYVKFFYVGFMPNAFSVFTDKPSDSLTGQNFEGKLTQLNENEASMGFDYIYINHEPTTTSVQIGLYDKNNNLISMTDAIDVPIQRSNHTVVTGSFMMSEASASPGIDPDYDGDFNLNF